MNCRKARLEKSRHDSLELQNHLKSCPECSRLAEAESMLENALTKARELPDTETTPFRILQARVTAQNELSKGGLMKIFQNKVSAHPKFRAGLAIFMAVVIFAVLIPMPYQTTVGYEVKFTGPDKNSTESISELSKALDAIGYSQVAINTSLADSEINYTISNLATLQAAKEVSATIDAISRKIDEISKKMPTEISPVFGTANASLLAQAGKRLLDIEVEGKGKTDEQIEAEIRAKLAAEGVTNGKVDVKTDSTGNRNISISIDSLADSIRNIEKLEIETKGNDATGKESEIKRKMQEIEIRPRGNDTSKININLDRDLPKIDVDSKGKTNAEIENEIINKLNEQGHPNADVKVETDSKGQRKIQIEMQDSLTK